MGGGGGRGEWWWGRVVVGRVMVGESGGGGEGGGGGEWWWGRVVAWGERRKRVQRAGDEERQKMGEGEESHVNTDIYIIAGQS